LGGFFCPTCHGYGRVQTQREFSLSIPPHVRHGTEIRLSMEDIGLRDVYLNIIVLIDPDFGRRGRVVLISRCTSLKGEILSCPYIHYCRRRKN
jgi:DnaJ-class molecular chaperone